ncbi:MAG: [acyl-carrier-protein] S-malonyltransferase [Candidatus Omnitrophica bacterium CG07_land_8_20_14_0_80_50_8]|nr:MAG: [acyl-carrier-protein] S-malonyltransferase [Candidatus Omnitrophica bacterium CG07_land_8_20_14_0_80_50_8]
MVTPPPDRNDCEPHHAFDAIRKTDRPSTTAKHTVREAIGSHLASRSGGGVTREVAYLFPGQGSQFTGMGKDLYDIYPVARRIFDQAARLVDFDIRSVCFEGPPAKLTQTRFSQPAIFVVSIAALEVLKSHSKSKILIPKFAAGLSLGEATALCAAGAISFEDGVRFVLSRGRFMDEAATECPGLMAAVLGADLPVVEEACRITGAEVGNLNAPGQIIISGKKKNVELAIEKLRGMGASKVIPLDVSGGFHSSCMDSACRRIEQALKEVLIQQPKIPVVSNLTADVEESSEKIKQNLVWQMNHRTLWEDSMRYIIGKGIKTFIEFSPGKVLKGLLRKIDPTIETISLSALEDFHAID